VLLHTEQQLLRVRSLHQQHRHPAGTDRVDHAAHGRLEGSDLCSLQFVQVPRDVEFHLTELGLGALHLVACGAVLDLGLVEVVLGHA
jgi:hypothetical protein